MEQKIGQLALWMADKKATNIQAFDLRGISPLTEAMLVVTVRSARHAQALAGDLVLFLAENNWEHLGVEGGQHGQWVLVDGNDVIVHIFQEEARALYNMEGLHSKAKPFALPAGINDQEQS